MSYKQETIEEIASQNDLFRGLCACPVMTQGALMLEPFELIQAVRKFNDFNKDNDPYGEHDFGSLDWHGVKVFWKIDYYDASLSEGRSPLDDDCQRVLTIMRADEY